MPNLSIVIPVYNAEKTIQETLNSVFCQTYQDFEIIAIDDGSTDSSLQVLQQLKQPKLRIYTHKNSGPSISRNRGIERATGNYIAFLDADDLWTPDKLEKQLKALQEHPEAALAYSWTDYIDESGNSLKSGSHPSFEGNVYAELLVSNFIENGSNVLARKQSLIEVGGFDPALRRAEDWDLWLRIARQHPFALVPEPQVLYRVSPHSSSAQIRKQEQQSLFAIDRAFAKAPESLQHLKKQSLISLYKYLTFKALEGEPSSKNGRIVLQYFWKYLYYNPVLFKQPRVVAGLFARTIAMMLLPSAQFKQIFARSH